MGTWRWLGEGSHVHLDRSSLIPRRAKNADLEKYLPSSTRSPVSPAVRVKWLHLPMRDPAAS
jgi:hypothetical protein